MKIDYISDTHFDTHLGHGDFSKERFMKSFAPVFETRQSDTLILAGDIGEDNYQNIEALRLIRDEFKYKHIVMVLGNHDWFLSDRMAIDTYKRLSINRVNEFKEMVANEKGMHLLDGDIVEVNGIRIGGTMSWYDGMYSIFNLNPHYTKSKEYVQVIWKQYYPDSKYIWGGLDNFDDFLKPELAKIEKVHKHCDIMITHVNPSIRKEHTTAKWQKEDTSGFFSFNGDKFLYETTASYWIFGHSHDIKEFEYHGVKCLCSPFGYPGENTKDFRVKSFEAGRKDND